MRSSLQSSTALVSSLIRLNCATETTSTRICSPKRSLRVPSAPSPSRLPVPKTQSSPKIQRDETTQNQANIVAREGSTIQRSWRRKGAARSASNWFDTQPQTEIFRHPVGNAIAPISNEGHGDHPAIGTRSSSARHLEPQAVADHETRPQREHWQIQKDALKIKFGEQGWSPRKKLSPDTMEGIRALHEQFPQKYTTPVLAEQFKVSPEAIRRILKSKWRPSPEKTEERRGRWAKRHDRIWDAQAEMGLRPKRTKDRKPEGPEKLDEIIPVTPRFAL
jgi:Neugrin